jgi:hypothetical protein
MQREGEKMPKFISKKHLEICNNLSYDLGFNQTINPELFQYLPNTFFEIVFAMPHGGDDHVRTRISFPMTKELKKKFTKHIGYHFELNMDLTWEDYESLNEWNCFSEIMLTHELEQEERRLNQ